MSAKKVALQFRPLGTCIKNSQESLIMAPRIGDGLSNFTRARGAIIKELTEAEKEFKATASDLRLKYRYLAE